MVGVYVFVHYSLLCVHLSKMQSTNSGMGPHVTSFPFLSYHTAAHRIWSSWWDAGGAWPGFTPQSLNSVLKHQYKGAREEKNQPLVELLNILRNSTYPCAGQSGSRRGARKERGSVLPLFPTLSVASAVAVSCSTEEVNYFVHNALSDPDRDLELEPHTALITPQPLTFEFAMRDPSWTEGQEVVKRARSASAPGPSWHCVQALATTPSAPVEESLGDLVQGKSCQAVEICRRCMDPQQREFKEHQSVQSHDFLQRPVAMSNQVPPEEQLYWPLYSEG